MATYMKDPTGQTILRFETGYTNDIKGMIEGGWEKVTEADFKEYTDARSAIFSEARARARAEALAAVDKQFEALTGVVDAATTIASTFGQLPKVDPSEDLKAVAKVTSTAVDFAPTAEGTTSVQSAESGIQLLDVFGSKSNPRASKVKGA
jgi:hypothetical protein